VNIALPSAQKALSVSDANRQSIVTAYSSRSAACCRSSAASAICSAANAH